MFEHFRLYKNLSLIFLRLKPSWSIFFSIIMNSLWTDKRNKLDINTVVVVACVTLKIFFLHFMIPENIPSEQTQYDEPGEEISL